MARRVTREPAGPARSAELHDQLATALLDSVDEPSSTTIHLFYGQVATQIIAAMSAERADGTREARRTPDAVIDVLESLRTAEAAPGRGAWISTTVTMQDGRLHADVNWDRRIFQNPADPFVPGTEPWMQFPDDDDWRIEFRVHPRSAEAVPVWARALVPDAEDDERARVSAERTRAALLAAKGTFPGALAPLESAWGWPDIWEAVQDHVDTSVAAARTSVITRLSAHHERERETALTALAQDTWDLLYAELFDGRDNQFLLDVFEAMPLVRPQAAAFDSSRIDPQATFALEGDEDVYQAFEIVDSVLGEMIDVELDQRLAQIRG
ncbi:hypothetical protein ACIPJ2_01850 [Curtobacterium sp. NPDC090217]|uniref:hypothetical protein n=1 Tax=Curtobacterium sp. NPDC090217 TaxID=3363970 RepID=UPI0037F41556